MEFIKRLFDKSPRIETKRLILRRMRVGDAADMFDYAKRPEVTKYLLWAPHEDIEYTKNYMRQVERGYKQGNFWDFGVVLKENGRLIGTCGFARLDKANATAEAGYVLNPDYWGRGLAAEALSSVIRMGFELYELNRIESRYMVGNSQSRRVMEKCGMEFEGILRQSVFDGEGYSDVGVCAILKRDFRADRDAFQKFTNF